ncbi:MAG: 50S ribosomal protein L5 [Gemmatimonadota bacterium]|nr:50S ribosomal protein L5 [Gemmatimonadota bacterium]MDH4347730.1 50S ribosomal protein L5 [Gemmatimonadota bacterium]
MAETKEKAAKSPKEGAAPPKSGKGGKEKGGAGYKTDPAPKRSEGTPRLKTHYEQVVRPNLAKQFGLSNPNAVPRLVKVVINVGIGEGARNPKLIDNASEELSLITGQKAVIRRSKKAIANFNLRQGLPVGTSVTLRGVRMYEFLDRFISLTIPRIRDFRGLPNRSFDGRGNYTFGLKEQMVFPEIDFDKVDKIHGMDITIVTTAGRDDLAMALLREFGWPFRGETPLAVA